MRFTYRDVQRRIRCTGDLPDEMLGVQYGGLESFEELMCSDRQCLWSGCLDAPDCIPAGSVYGSFLGYSLLAAPTSTLRFRG